MTTTERRALRTILLIGLGAAALAMTGCARRAYVQTTYPQPTYATAGAVTVYSAPPAAPVAVHRPVAPYAGAVWVDGHYTWNGAQYVWVDGYYVQPRAGYTFVQPRWVHQGGRYVYVQGGWARGGRVVHHVAPPRVVARPGRVVVQPHRAPAYRPAPGRVVVQPRHHGAHRAPPPRGGVHRAPPPRVHHRAPSRGVRVRAQPGGVRVRHR